MRKLSSFTLEIGSLWVDGNSSRVKLGIIKRKKVRESQRVWGHYLIETVICPPAPAWRS